MRSWLLIMGVVCALLTVQGSLASDVEIGDGCHTGGVMGVAVGFEENVSAAAGTLIVNNNCTGGTEVQFLGANIDLLGPIVDGEIVITKDSVYVDTVARPDLELPAKIIFKNVGIVFEPNVLRNGVLCLEDCTEKSFDYKSQVYSLSVQGFSNYSLQARKDFIVYSDPQAELDAKVYQTIDLNDSNRDREFACVVQIYGRNQDDEWVLVQTNPKRAIQAKLWGSPDVNQPESLGYFPTKNGMANVYYDGSSLAGYQEFEYVAQCADNSTKLVFEEAISTRYHPLGRSAVGRGLWLTDGTNALFLMLYLAGGFIVTFIVVRVVRIVWRSLTGRR